METLYRKVAVTERLPIKSGTYFSNEEEVYYRESTKKFEHNYDAHCVYPQWWIEEITDPTVQLKADKAELLELMTEMKESFDHKAWVTGMELKSFSSRIESLIQKHKQ